MDRRTDGRQLWWALLTNKSAKLERFTGTVLNISENWRVKNQDHQITKHGQKCSFGAICTQQRRFLKANVWLTHNGSTCRQSLLINASAFKYSKNLLCAHNIAVFKNCIFAVTLTFRYQNLKVSTQVPPSPENFTNIWRVKVLCCQAMGSNN